MIIDSFIFFNELSMLDLRLNILKDKVDMFILTESTMTFSGKPKPLYYEDNKDLFKEFQSRIIHVVVEDTPKTNITWDRERWQRNAIARGLQGICKKNDWVLTGDVDEIPDITTIESWFQDKTQVYHPMMEMYYYYLNSWRESQWFGTKICTWDIVNKLGVDPLRNVRTGYTYTKGGWHFSYCGNADHIRIKMDAFSDIELNNETVRSHLEENIKNNKDLFFRGQTMKIVPIDESFPKYLRDNQDKYKHLIKEL